MDWLVCKSSEGVELEIGCDLLMSYKFDTAVELATYPVEKGFDVNDHVIVQPDKLSVTLLQSRTPLSSLTVESKSEKSINVRQSEFGASGLLFLVLAVKNGISELGNMLGIGETDDGKRLKVITYDLKPNKDYPNEIHNALVKSQKFGHECTVTMKGKTYAKLKMKMVSREYAAGVDGADSFSIDFEEFRVVETKTTKLPSPKDLAPKTVIGKKGSDTTGADEEKKVRSSMYKKAKDSLVTGALGP